MSLAGNWSSHQWGGLDCRTFDMLPPGVAPKLLTVLCHGFGAPGNDLDPLGPALFQLQPQLAEGVRFMFPAAPLSLDAMGMFGGRAWWPLDMEQLAAAVEQGRFRDLRNDQPPELPAAREKLASAVQAAQEEAGLGNAETVLGGFSQGAMIATDLALRLPESPAGLCVFSGTLLNEAEWRTLAAARGGLNVLQTHGRLDPLLPFQAAQWLCEMLTASGANVEFTAFDGPHAIPQVAMERCALFLHARLAESGSA